ncbi:exodeoxyribonuclease V subunit beta [Pseudolysobacter antarcticus]|uniref:RecBCD enzyme subunit RecB n=1 Tax=Pseudolysobacter antarcticus TaxID=2511995 RepID=A0A411HJI4_9GAMM|nr:exodeoxyribonuclease V subunit beta [Pseudolysobacter antarcticus]QBB70574.1 exodeoxyribonuclease V subunit beta [Pseudolysobacter antarcticus]
MNVQPLQLLTAPLTGTTLVEASAGTGKTYSIAWLYLRLLLERRLPVQQILVVTFTEAAADELRTRIRARLVWMRTCLANLSTDTKVQFVADSTDQKLLDGIIANCAALDISRDEIALLLDLAVPGFDEAAIHTIHGYCRRVLAEFALDGGVPLRLSEPGNEVALRLRFVEDFWRREIHADDPIRSGWLLRCFDQPQTLAQAIRDLVTLPDYARAPRDPAHELRSLENTMQRAFAYARNLWSAEAPAHIETLFADKTYGMSRAKASGMDAATLQTVCSELDDYFSQGHALVLFPEAGNIFRPEMLEKNQNASAREKGKPLPQDALLTALGELSECAESILQMHAAKLLVETSDYVRAEMKRHEEISVSLGFDSLIGRLHDALCGDDAERLATRLRDRYPVALVDEFQDTDQRQYAIFRRVYAERGVLLMIGDAKQAIYGFRGGDIFAYAAAREDAQAQVFTLDTNYRSEPALSKALNQLFRDPRTFVVDFIPWRDVQAGGPKQGRWLHPSAPPLTFWHAEVTDELRDTRKSKITIATVGRLEQKIAGSVASEIVRLLQAGAKQQIVLDLPGAAIAQRGLRAGDIAVLVVSQKQALLVETALRSRGVAVSRRARESVFASDEAHELILLLRALLEPTRAPKLRAALTTLLFGLDAGALQALDASDEGWEITLLQFAALATRWREQGVLSLILEILRAAAPRLLPLHDGERRIANYLQLGELLDEASTKCAGPVALLAWLQQHRLAPDTENKAQLLRLDSDAQAVQVVTIHSSKGLEYPIVFAPFLWKGKNKKNAVQVPVISHDENYRVVADLGTPKLAARARQRELENYAESIRLAYVACTRAINRLYLVWGNTDAGAYSPLLRLLDPATADNRHAIATPDEAIMADRLARLRDDSDGAIDVCALPELSAERWFAQVDSIPLHARPFIRSLFDARRTLSFTRLVQGMHVTHAADHDAVVETSVALGEVSASVSSLLRGAEFGECLHQILERIDFSSDDVVALRRIVAEQVQRAGFAAASEAQFLALVRATLDAELLPRLRLRTLSPQSRVAEMEFHFRLASGASAVLIDLAQRYPEYAAALQVLGSAGVALQGLMNGFIDLTLAHEGRFYVLDYKSNWLGPDARDYAPPRLAQAMEQHRYDLQALIYQVALHRYLRLRLGARYRTELLGGALYVFVRGLNTANAGAGVVHQQPSTDLVEALDQWFDGE